MASCKWEVDKWIRSENNQSNQKVSTPPPPLLSLSFSSYSNLSLSGLKRLGSNFSGSSKFSGNRHAANVLTCTDTQSNSCTTLHIHVQTHTHTDTHTHTQPTLTKIMVSFGSLYPPRTVSSLRALDTPSTGGKSLRVSSKTSKRREIF